MNRGGFLAHLEACAQNGLTAIRLLVCLAPHRGAAGLKPGMLRQVEAIVDEATALGLAVVISNHRDPALMTDPAAHLPANLVSVAQVAKALEGRGDDVVFEPLTEPQEALNAIWNE